MHQVIHFLIPLIYFNLLVYSYIYYNVEIWGYLGYSSDFSIYRYAIAFVAVIILRAMTPKKIDTFSSFIFSIFSSTSVIIVITLFAARGFDLSYLISVLLFYGLARYISVNARFDIPMRRISFYPVVSISIIFIVIPILWVIYRGGLNALNFDLSNIYNVRYSASENYFVGIFVYLNNWAIKIFLPLVLAFGIIRRNVFLILFPIVAALFFYATFAQKAPIAIVAFVFMAIWVTKRKYSTGLLDLLMSILIISAIGLYELGFINPIAIVVNRVLFGPANNNILYYEFFKENPFTFFSNSFLRSFVQYPYEQHVFDIISIIRTGDVGINPNTGVLGTGYMHAGYAGIMMYSILIGFFIGLVESLTSKSMPLWIPAAVAGPPIYLMLTSVDLPVGLFTAGLIVAIVLLFFTPPIQKRNYKWGR